MAGQPNMIEVFELARKLYAANPSHAAPNENCEAGTVCLIYALADACSELKMQYLYNPAYDLMGDILDHKVVLFNYKHTTKEVLAVFDQIISELKAKECSATDATNHLVTA